MQRLFKFLMVFLTVAIIAIFLIIVEIYLTKRGFAPGFWHTEFFLVDSLIVTYPIICDSSGINKHNAAKRLGVPVNKDGFISSYDFTPENISLKRAEGKKIIMVLGDSFTEGIVPGGRDSSFMEILRRETEGYEFLNFGLGASDPLNYKLIAEKYIPVVQPDLILINFCAANDGMDIDRVPSPGIPIAFHLNCFKKGPLVFSQKPLQDCNVPHDLFRTGEEAYRYFVDRYSLWGSNAGTLEKIARLSNVTTQLYNKFKKQCDLPEIFYAYQHLTALKQMADQNNIPLLIAYIPPMPAGDDKGERLKQEAFRDLAGMVSYPPRFSNEDYISLQNQHFSDSGNRKFAEFLKDKLAAIRLQ